MPTTTEVPAPLILHFESPSPFTPLGAKGVGEGNCMSTPVCIANAVADALGVAAHRPAADAGQARGADAGMKPAPFDYLRAETLAEAHAALAAEGGDAAVIAGGQSLVPLLSMRMARPKLVVDIMHVARLGGIAVEDDAIRVGAAVRQAELLAWPELAERQPLLAQALPWVGHWQTRARGTVCGSIALADPSAELPLVLVALGGERRCFRRQAGRRSVAADDFFTGLMSTARRDDELIEAVSFPVPRSRRRLCVPRVRAPARRLRHRGLRGGRDGDDCPARGRRRRGPAGGARLRTDGARSTTRSTPSPTSSTRATTCTRPRTIAAISCAASDAQTIAEAQCRA